MKSELMTVDDVAADLHISKRHVYELIKRDLQPVVRFGNVLRIERHVVDRYVESHREPRTLDQASSSPVYFSDGNSTQGTT
jgi:excisionase family DNA binding protein